jgi:WD40 repeat protein
MKHGTRSPNFSLGGWRGDKSPTTSYKLQTTNYKLQTNMKPDTWTKLPLLLCAYLLSVDSIAAPTPSPFPPEQTLEKRLTTIDHRSEVTSVTFSPDGRLLAYGSADNRVRLWDVQSGRLLKSFEGHTQSVTSVAFSADGLMLASGSEDKTIRLWDIDSKTFLKTFEGHRGVVNSIAFHPEGNLLASSSNGGTIRLWNIRSGELLRKPFKWQVRSMRTVAFSPDGKMLATGASDLKVRLWNTRTFKMYKPRMTCTKYQHVISLDFSSNSRMLASGFRHGMVCIWDAHSRKLIKRLYTHQTDAFSSVAFDAVGKRLAYSLSDKLFWWNIGAEEAVELPITLRDAYIRAVDFHPNLEKKNILAYASSDGTVRLWDIENNKLVGIFAGNAEGKWFSCLEAQQCWCSDKPCASPTTEPESVPDDKPLKRPSPTESIPPNLLTDDAEQDKEEASASFDKDLVTGAATTGDKPSTDAHNDVIIYLLILFILIGITIALFFYRSYICKKNAALLATPLPQLPQLHRLLKRVLCLTQVLAKNQVSAKDFEEALAFVQNSSPAEQAALLAKRLGAKQCEQTAADLFTVHLHDSFPLNLQRFLLYFPATEQTEQDILNQLHQRKEMELQKVVVITLNPEQLQALRPYGEDTSNLWMVPDGTDLTCWLLSATLVPTFTWLLTEQLKVTQVSPYQTHSGVNKDAVFFGRTQILDRILNRDPANYLIVGGRQLGKSSLIKHIHRFYQNHPQVQCHYLTLHGNSMQEQLAVTLGMPSDSDFDSLLNRLVEVAPGERRLLLIDQADQFIQAEMKNGYRTLNHFRSRSEEGRCYFILTGIWDLYYASVLDSQSPLKNFGEAIRIGALEADACRDLAIKPMKTMHLRYEREALVEELLRKTGQRANLIAIVCHEMLKGLKSHQRVLGEEEVTQAFNSEAVREALKGWGMLSVDEQENSLDRIIVYATVKQGEFKLEELMSLLETHGCTYSAEQVKHSLERLALSFVIKRESQGRYVYSVPLLRERLLEDDVDELLRWELKEEYNGFAE